MADVLDRHEWKFAHVDREYATLGSREAQDFLQKWDLKEGMQVATFGFDQTFRRGMADDFIISFFNSPQVREVLRFRDETGFMAPLGKISVKDAVYEPLECTKVRLDMLDKLADAGIVRSNGSIAKMMDQFLPAGVTISDELRCVLMNEDESEHAGLFTDDEKKEFLYHVLWRLVSGGAMCQYEDDFGIYKNLVRGVYKDLVSVQKKETGGIEAVSHVYLVKALHPLKLHGRAGFDNHNFCYLSINPVMRQVHVWYSSFASPF